MRPASYHARLGWQITGRFVASAGLGAFVCWLLILAATFVLGGCDTLRVIEIAGAF